MYYTIYKITNKLDGKFYIGSHKTKKLDDEYMGSGKYLISAQKKYGLENFEKEILFIFDNPKDMYNKESEIVNEDFLVTENTYNLKVGGFGGWDYLNSTGMNNSTKSKEVLKRAGYIHTEKLKNDVEYRKRHIQRNSERFKKLHKEGKVKYDTFTGKNHSTETKKKISETRKKNNRGIGTNNSQYGTRWVHNAETKQNKKIKGQIEDGWFYGKYKEPKVKLPSIRDIRKKEQIKIHREYYELYKKLGFIKFVEITGYNKTQANLVQQFQKLLDNFLPQNGKKRNH